MVRVIREGAPNWPTSRAENDCTRSKIAARRSRPRAIAVRAPKYTAAIAQRICTRVTDSMIPLSRMM